MVEIDVSRDALNSVVHDALRYYDLPDLVGLIGEDRVNNLNPVDASGSLIPL